MAKRGQRYPYRVRYVWTTGATGVIVASSLDDAQLKADRIEAYGLARDDADVTITIVYVAQAGNPGTPIGTRNTAQQEEPTA